MRAIRGQLEVIQEIVFEIVIYQMEVSELLTSCTTLGVVFVCSLD